MSADPRAAPKDSQLWATFTRLWHAGRWETVRHLGPLATACILLRPAG